MCKGIEFLAFQEKINSLLKKGKVKDYYNVIGGLLNTKKTILEFNEIEDPDNPDLVICDPELVRSHLNARYSEIFSSHAVREPFQINDIEATNLEETLEACTSIS